MYIDIYEAWKREKERVEIQPLLEDFYIRLTRYIKKLIEASEMTDRNSIEGRLMQSEFQRIKKMVQELMLSRHNKLLKSSSIELLSGIITPEETSLYN